MSALQGGWRPRVGLQTVPATKQAPTWEWLEPRLHRIYEAALADGGEQAQEIARIVRGIYREGITNAEGGVLAAARAAGRVLELCAAIDAPSLAGPSLLRAARETFDYHRPPADPAALEAFG